MSETEKLRVAVATKDKIQINQHFGHADEFAIYWVDGAGVAFDETRQLEHYCQGGYGDEDRREIILRALADCAALFVARVGDGPREKLVAAGIEPVDEYPYGAIETSLLDWYRQRP
ncbi:MAG: dinitrogenase iron-molybdenum cofactor biosynthesis protein [Zoogloeaceae bacterium]|nr:dinitrogenase iron-molybdenum cofactor biosynthesis protein [Zoogloeaceae bacterium]